MSVTLSRRNLACGGLAAAASISAATGAQASVSEASKNEAVARAYYGLWATSKTWPPFDAILADNFTFSSPNGEDHIGKAEFKKECWDTQIGHTKGFDLSLVMSKDDRAIVEYVGHTNAGNTFHNVEVLRIRDGQITDIVCFFGGKATFPSAVDAQKS